MSAQLLGSGLIGLREGLEAGIVVMILIAFLVKSDRRDALKWVWLGVGGAIAVTVGVFLAILYSAYSVSGLAAEAVAGVASLLAVVIVTSMVLWMHRAAAGLSGDLKAGMSKALETGALAIVMLSFLAVGREGVETGLFMAGYAEATTAWPLVGLLIGVGGAAAITWGMYAGAVRINLSKFFTYTGVFLIVVAAGILSTASGRCRPSAGCRGWGSTPSTSAPGSLELLVRRDRPGIFNITPTPTVLQLVGWLAYLSIVPLFLRPAPAPGMPPPQSRTMEGPLRDSQVRRGGSRRRPDRCRRQRLRI